MDIHTITQHDLDTAEKYSEGHLLRSVAEIVRMWATGRLTIASAIATGWSAGYQAKEEEWRDMVQRSAPPKKAVDVELAKDILAQCPNEDYQQRATKEWTWNAEACGWSVDGDDCTIRPGSRGVIVLEAGGEYAGHVVMVGDAICEFGEGCFLA